MKNKIEYILSHSVPHTLNTTFNKIATRFKWNFASLEPRFIETEVTNRCNLQCIHCTRTNHYLSGDKPLDIGALSVENFRKIIDQFQYLDCITLQGLGEPFLNEKIFKIIRLAKKRKINVAVTSNLSVLNEKLCNKLIQSGVNKEDNLVLSIDSFHKESFEKIRPPIKIEHIISNLKTCVRICKERTNMSLHLVITNENIDHLENYIITASHIGIKDVSFSDQNFDMAGENIEQLRIKDPVKLRVAMQKASRISKEKGVSFSYYKLDPNIWPAEEWKHPCWFVWSYPYITWDGYVTPCCARPYPKEFNFGNVFKTHFREIWNGKAYRQFRRSLKFGKIPKICIGCPHSVF